MGGQEDLREFLDPAQFVNAVLPEHPIQSDQVAITTRMVESSPRAVL
ncbi:hypothetical protein RMSM_01005 [Rhodopirellula maiorica SM1]|uniref:Uncharacterized protein n=1 Tax=Rhodopirellula maiorica SM1 TaxID=1265738 RepID=M5S353_9BACT|nr:hypothetical protein RMSM_01005 [Rhodopirellula maiorica SM1]